MSGWASVGAPVLLAAKAKPAPKSTAHRRSQSSDPSSSMSSSVGLLSSAVSRGRSRSPQRVALPGLRADGPGRLERRFMGIPHVLSEDERAAALEKLDMDILAVTTQRTNAARLRTIEAALALWGIPMWPPTPVSFKALAATLKLGQYSSAATYFSAYRTAAERQGFLLDELAIRSIKDYTRSCLRGLGGPVRPRPLPFDRLCELPGDRSAWVAGGPVNPKALICIGAWWLCREIELANARASMVEFSGTGRGLIASLHLPASKSDQLALGIARSLRCTCSPSPSSLDRANCPVHMMVDHILFLQRLFPSQWRGGVALVSLPLFPRADGAVVDKNAMRDTIIEGARLLGISQAAPDGTERVSGHSLRVTGAQGLVIRGWDLWTVQLHGRWGSDVIKRYVRDSPLAAVASGRGPAARQGLDLEAVVAAISRIVQPQGRVEPAVVQEAVCPSTSAGQPPLAETAAQLEVERIASVEPEPQPLRFVLNTRSGTYHRRVDAASFSAACGWSFRTNPHAFVPDVAAGPKSKAQLCARCWPTLRSVASATGVVSLVADVPSSGV